MSALSSARARWAAEYRAARSAYRLYDTFRDRFPKDSAPDFLYHAWKACPGYCATRFYSDLLGNFTVLGVRALHLMRMHHLTRRVRLPA